ncbi:MAG TPA: DUF3422 family protein, partial [Pseudomonadales bacterium]|nr:DUF3422 family protein [Pseudomonadales bacterium]
MLLSHPLRLPLHDEVHQRPGLAVPTPARLSTVTVTDTDAASHRLHLNKLLAHWQKPLIGNDVVHADIEFDGTILRWSLHNEFARFTLMQTEPEAADFEKTALQSLPRAWCEAMPGKIIFAMHALVLPEEHMQESLAESARVWFEGRPLVGSRIAHEQAIAISDFFRHPDSMVEHGAARLVIFNFAAGKRLIGRMLQDFFEMETYRMMALLSFPLAKKLLPVVTELEDTLQSITNAIAGGEDPELT